MNRNYHKKQRDNARQSCEGIKNMMDQLGGMIKTLGQDQNISLDERNTINNKVLKNLHKIKNSGTIDDISKMAENLKNINNIF